MLCNVMAHIIIHLHVAERSLIQSYFHVQQGILQFAPGESSISNGFVEGLLDKAHHSLELPTPPWCFGEAELPLDVQLEEDVQLPVVTPNMLQFGRPNLLPEDEVSSKVQGCGMGEVVH